MDEENRCPTCGRSVHEAPPSTRLESGDESIVGRNLTWALGLMAVLYMLVKVFLVARGDPAVARSIAGAVGVNSLVAGVIVAGLPDLACLLLVVSALWVAFDLMRQRRSATEVVVVVVVVVVVLGGISWIVGILTAREARLVPQLWAAVSLISLVVFLSIFASNFEVTGQPVRPFLLPFILLVLISVPTTALKFLDG
jgi:hypothetical protein